MATQPFKETNMLVLSRRPQEAVVIDGTIRVTVLSIQGNKVRLGITAPPSVRVDREEVHRQVMEFVMDGPICAECVPAGR
jgi:carbon storage regulator